VLLRQRLERRAHGRKLIKLLRDALINRLVELKNNSRIALNCPKRVIRRPQSLLQGVKR
jgi:vacuolar-type H+-ATPase subunit D/Vma8